MSGRFENIDGHRVWVENSPAVVAPTAPEDAPRPTDSDQQPAGGATELPTFDVKPGYVMRLDTIALHFPAEHVNAVIAHPLFAPYTDQLRAAAIDIEQEAEWQRDQAGIR